MLETIYLFIIASIPSLMSLFSLIGIAIKIFKDVRSMTDGNEKLKEENEELKEVNKKLREESIKLRKTIALAIKKKVKIDYNSLTEVKNDEDLQI